MLVLFLSVVHCHIYSTQSLHDIWYGCIPSLQRARTAVQVTWYQYHSNAHYMHIVSAWLWCRLVVVYFSGTSPGSGSLLPDLANASRSPNSPTASRTYILEGSVTLTTVCTTSGYLKTYILKCPVLFINKNLYKMYTHMLVESHYLIVVFTYKVVQVFL